MNAIWVQAPRTFGMCRLEVAATYMALPYDLRAGIREAGVGKGGGAEYLVKAAVPVVTCFVVRGNGGKIYRI